MFHTIPRRIRTALGILFVLASITTHAGAQEGKYQPGERIEYRASGFPEKWGIGVYVGSTPDGTQPIIREKPNEFFKDGSQRASTWEEIRPLTAKQPEKAAPAAVRQPIPEGPPKPAPDQKTIYLGNEALDGELLTQGEIRAFLQDRLGETPFADSRKLQQTKLDLAELIKKRGLNFRYEVLSDFGKQIGKFGMTSEVAFPLQSNFGSPTKLAWLIGDWALGKIAPTVTHIRGDYLVTQGEFGVSGLGVLSIRQDGTYLWKVQGEREPIRGSWREATPQEMKDQGGAGVVLSKAKTGYDWIVSADRNTTVKGNWINISEIKTRQIREFGKRKK